MYIYSILYLIDAIYFLIALGILMMETKTNRKQLFGENRLYKEEKIFSKLLF